MTANGVPERIRYRAADALEASCTFLDNHTPAWMWLMGWLRCPNGWLARAAFWLDGTTRQSVDDHDCHALGEDGVCNNAFPCCDRCPLPRQFAETPGGGEVRGPVAGGGPTPSPGHESAADHDCHALGEDGVCYNAFPCCDRCPLPRQFADDRAPHQCPTCKGWHDWEGVCIQCRNTPKNAETIPDCLRCGKPVPRGEQWQVYVPGEEVARWPFCGRCYRLYDVTAANESATTENVQAEQPQVAPRTDGGAA